MSECQRLEERLSAYQTAAHALIDARAELLDQEEHLERLEALLWLNEAVTQQPNDRQRKAAYEGLKLEDEQYRAQLAVVRATKREIAELEVEERIARKRVDWSVNVAGSRLTVGMAS